MGTVSADHLDYIDEEDARLLARSDTSPRCCSARCHLGSYRAASLIEAGAAVPLATDYNPGTSPTCNMQIIMSLACSQMRMTPAEAFSAATINGAHALRLGHRVGSIETGKRADLVMFDASDYREIPYHFGVNLVAMTMKGGQVLYRKRTGHGKRELIECVPNFSEGRERNCRGSGRRGAHVPAWWLDQEMDADTTVRVDPGRRARGRLRGRHPRGWQGRRADRPQSPSRRGIRASEPPMFVPFVPVEGVALEECVRIAAAWAKRSGGASRFPSISTRRPRAGPAA